jgi:hypothetical protein
LRERLESTLADIALAASIGMEVLSRAVFLVSQRLVVVATISPCCLRTLTRHHRPVPNQAIAHRSSGHSAVITGPQLSAIFAKPSLTTAAPAPNPHRPPSAHRLPAGSFIGGFPTPAPLPRVDRSHRAGIRNPSREQTFERCDYPCFDERHSYIPEKRGAGGAGDACAPRLPRPRLRS